MWRSHFRFACENCGLHFTTRKYITRLMWSSHQLVFFPFEKWKRLLIQTYLTNDEDDTVSKSNNNENNEHNGIFYLCDGWNFQGTTEGIFNKLVENIYERVHYTCSQCDYKATTNPNLKRHVEAINELVCYSCSQCYYKATTNDSLKKHVESLHESYTPVLDVILKEQQRVCLINM